MEEDVKYEIHYDFSTLPFTSGLVDIVRVWCAMSCFVRYNCILVHKDSVGPLKEPRREKQVHHILVKVIIPY